MEHVERYSTTNGKLVPGFGGDVSEDHVGWDAAELVFPNISSCTGVAAVTAAGRAAGFHLTISTPAAAVDALVAKALEFLQNTPPARILLFGVLAAPPSPPDPLNPDGGWKLEARYAWPQQIKTFQAAFNAAGAQVRVLTQHGAGTLDYRVLTGRAGAATLHARPAGGADWTAVSTVRMA